MPTSLDSLHIKLKRRLWALDSGFDRYIIEPAIVQRIDRYALQEGYVSALWQAWCSFCRELLIHSAMGAVTRSGVLTTSPHLRLDEMEIAHVAGRLAYNKNINPIRRLVGSHQEHTWGDLSKLNLVASSIGCSNAASILSGLSACLRIEDLQLCRNASAHISRTMIDGVRSSKVRYLGTSLNHPSDMMRWVDPSNSDFLWKAWIYEMELASELATQ